MSPFLRPHQVCQLPLSCQAYVSPKHGHIILTLNILFKREKRLPKNILMSFSPCLHILSFHYIRCCIVSISLLFQPSHLPTTTSYCQQMPIGASAHCARLWQNNVQWNLNFPSSLSAYCATLQLNNIQYNLSIFFFKSASVHIATLWLNNVLYNLSFS